jgi:hypothetical protein
VDLPDLTGAEIYVETQDPPVAGGRWYVLASDAVLYQRSDGGFNPTAIVPAHTLRTSSSWRAISAMESDN